MIYKDVGNSHERQNREISWFSSAYKCVFNRECEWRDALFRALYVAVPLGTCMDP